MFCSSLSECSYLLSSNSNQILGGHPSFFPHSPPHLILSVSHPIRMVLNPLYLTLSFPIVIAVFKAFIIPHLLPKEPLSCFSLHAHHLLSVPCQYHYRLIFQMATMINACLTQWWNGFPLTVELVWVSLNGWGGHVWNIALPLCYLPLLVPSQILQDTLLHETVIVHATPTFLPNPSSF